MNDYIINDTDLLKSLNRRYATKKMDPEKPLSNREADILKEAVRLAPSSYGLQPYEVSIISDDKTREELLEHTWNQKQIVDGSHLFVFAAYNSINRDYVEKFLKHKGEINGISDDAVQKQTDFIWGDISKKSEEEMKCWTAKQAYLCLGQTLTAAAIAGIDACPMEGFDPKGYDAYFNYAERNLSTAVVMAAGHRHKDDGAQHAEKVRRPENELFRVIE